MGKSCEKLSKKRAKSESQKIGKTDAAAINLDSNTQTKTPPGVITVAQGARLVSISASGYSTRPLSDRAILERTDFPRERKPSPRETQRPLGKNEDIAKSNSTRKKRFPQKKIRRRDSGRGPLKPYRRTKHKSRRQSSNREGELGSKRGGRSAH